MTAADYLQACSRRAERLGPRGMDLDLRVAEIDFYDVFMPLIVIQGLAKFDARVPAIYLCGAALKGLKRFTIAMVRALGTTQEKCVDQGGLLVICATRLSLREIYTPLAKARDGRRICLGFTTTELHVESESAARELDLPVLRPTRHGIGIALRISAAVFGKAVLAAAKTVMGPRGRRRETIFVLSYIVFVGLPLITASLMLLDEVERRKYRTLLSEDPSHPAIRLHFANASLQGIRSNLIQFGHCDRDAIEWRFADADRVFVWGKYYASIISGLHERRGLALVPIGSPRFDYAFSLKAGHRRAPGPARVLVLSTYEIGSYAGAFGPGSLEALKAEVRDSLHLVAGEMKAEVHFKLHPYEPTDGGIWGEGLGNRARLLPGKLDMRPELGNYDVAVSFGSGLTLDCMIARIPVLLPDWIPGLPWEYGALVAAGAIDSTSRADFERQVRSFLSGRSERVEEEQARTRELATFVQQSSPVSKIILNQIFAS